MGSHLTWPHGPPVSEGFFWTLFCVRRLFLDPFCVVGRSKKNLGSGGGGRVVFWPGFLSDLSGIAPCQTSEFPFDLASWASSVEGFFWTLFCVRRLFLDPFCVVGRPKKTLAVGGWSFSGQAFFRPFWNSPLSDVWVPVWAPF